MLRALPIPAVYERDTDAGAADVTPRPPRSTDATRLTLPIGVVVAIVITVAGFAISQAVSLAGMRSDVRDILTRMEYEAKLNESEGRRLDQRFQALESKIESAGLRNANMAMAQEMAKQKR